MHSKPIFPVYLDVHSADIIEGLSGEMRRAYQREMVSMEICQRRDVNRQRHDVG